MKKIACIPARYHSTRLEGKVLKDLGGKTVLERVLEAVESFGGFDEILVLTDHESIQEVAGKNGFQSIMTPVQCASGTDRIIHALPYIKGDIIINIQADEPFIKHTHLDNILKLLLRKDVAIGTLCHRLTDETSLFDYNQVKVVKNQLGQAMYFSRQVIPAIRDEKYSEWINHHTYFKHIGIYGFKRIALEKISILNSSQLELAEKLEQLRWMDHGLTVHVEEVMDPPITGIDTEEDYLKALKFLSENSDS